MIHVTDDYLSLLAAAEDRLALLAIRHRPRVGLVLGSGLGGAPIFAPDCDESGDAAEVPFSEIPGMPSASVAGHAGTMSFIDMHGVPTIAMRGRLHLYEGHAPQVVVHPIRLMARLGIEVLVLTNAAGGLVPELRTGDIMCLSDHINLTGTSPLIGPNADELGERFPVMRDVYDPQLRARAAEVAPEHGVDLKEGVYAGVLGPQFETPAEVAAIAAMGAHAVGMSTVLEAIAARHMGVRVVGFSLVTNAAGVHEEGGHEAVLAAGAASADRMAGLIGGLVEAIVRAT